MRALTRGLLAGAAGTTALNLVTYGDMLLRARPASPVPAEVAAGLADRAGVGLGGGEETSSREQAAGALLGYVTGLGVGAAYGLLRGAGRGRGLPGWLEAPLLGALAMAGSDVPSAGLGVTDPRTWGADSWVSDVVPHLAYGVVTVAAYRALD
ncbi:hypothetical protein V1J52_10415 [Streptomyces sp. TRM 70351]|uniref:hypothetical protein n=1 Tax=Streptomyces sp. TRM 70351 TaxID=3116552 RepID=UPI002E7B3597|nr:hypothetical protein [Streptomyces sp. TRM 70351]MEE1928601.1 hypothetical protein [Streptomyces sp. TRM 70351]